MVEQERSAGVIVFHSDGIGPAKFLLLDYGRHWDFPKGHLEAGESDEAAARRELLEETGIAEINLLSGFQFPMTYFFRTKKKGLVRKTVVLFLGRAPSMAVRLSSEHAGYDWLPFAEARQRITYSGARQALEAAEKFLTRST